MIYDDKERKIDFDFFIKNNKDLFAQYGHKFIAIQNKRVIGIGDDVEMLIATLSPEYQIGTYIIQECTGNDSSYIVRNMRFMIGEYASV